MKYILIILIVTIAGAGYIYRDKIQSSLLAAETTEVDKSKRGVDKTKQSSSVAVAASWDLPDRLKEISGLQYLDAGRFACVQDEEGVIFIYNINENRIEKEIWFAGPGDYEGLAVVGNDAYVVRSDGMLFQVADWKGKPQVKDVKTALTEDHNVEGLFYDAKRHRLLISIKDSEPGNKDYKGVYAYELATKQFNKEPVYKLPLQSDGSTKKKKQVKPSDIARHPVTDELYVLDGPASKLMILDTSGQLKTVVELGKAFEQPEGISFNEQGELFISNEGVKRPGNIKKVSLQ